MTGVSSDSGTTNSAGQLSFPRLRAGTYRLRFSGDSVVTFEREVTFRAGEILKVPVTLTAAEPPKAAAAPPPPPPPPAPPAPVVGPTGGPQIGSVSDLAEGERRAKERRYNKEWADAVEARGLLDTLEATTLSALRRQESRGAHYRDDFPSQNDAEGLWNGLITWRNGELSHCARAVVLSPTPG